MTSSLPHVGFPRAIRVPLLLLGATLTAACGGNTVLSAGTGGDSPSGDAGSGGSTSSMSSGGSGGAGGAGGSTGCSPECVLPEVCEEGTCKAPTELRLLADDIVVLQGGTDPGHLGRADACAIVHVTQPQDQLIGEEGGCKAYEPSDPDLWPEIPIDAGDVTVESPNTGVLPLGAGPGKCYQIKLANGDYILPEEGFQVGETVTFAATGGAMFPSFELKGVIPADMGLQENVVYQAGQPYEVTWTGETPQKILLIDSVNGRHIDCTPAPGGSLTVPASVTQYVGVVHWVKVVAYSASSAELPVSPSLRVTAAARRLEIILTN